MAHEGYTKERKWKKAYRRLVSINSKKAISGFSEEYKHHIVLFFQQQTLATLTEKHKQHSSGKINV